MDSLLNFFGLTALEIKIYKTLLTNGPSSAGMLAQKTGIHRRNIYDGLSRLHSKGLIGYLKHNNRNRYALTSPLHLQEQLIQQQQSLQEQLPSLLAQYHATHEKKETLFFQGEAGLRLIFEDQLRQSEEILVLATQVSVYDILRHFFPRYDLLRKERGIKTRMLFDSSYRKQQRVKTSLQRIPLCKARYVNDFNKSPLSQYIYGDAVALVVWSEQPIAILIKQKEVADGFRANFNVLWHMAKP